MDFGYWQLEGDRIAIKRLDDEKVSKGGIIIPDTAKEKINEGLLIAMGNEVWTNDQMERKAYCPFFEGQYIKFGKYAGSEVVGDDGEEYLIMRVHDILSYVPLYAHEAYKLKKALKTSTSDTDRVSFGKTQKL